MVSQRDMSEVNQSNPGKVMEKAGHYFSIYLLGIGLIVILNVQYLRYHPQSINWFPFTLATIASLVICIVGIEKLVSLWIEPPQFRQSKIPLLLRGCYYIPFLVAGFFMFAIGTLMLIGPAFFTERGPIWVTGFGEVAYMSLLSIAGYLVMRESFIQLRLLFREELRRRKEKRSSKSACLKNSSTITDR